MANRRTSLRKIRRLIKALREGVTGSRNLSQYCGLSHTHVIAIQKRIEQSSFFLKELTLLDDQALSAIVFPPEPMLLYSKPLPDFEKIRDLLSQRKKTGITRTLLWQEYREDHPDGYGLSQFNEHYRRWVKQQKKPSPPIDRFPGERLYADYSGLKMSYVNRETGEKIECEIYVSSMGHSGKIYCEASHTQSIPDWLKVTESAFRYYGGVSALITPDNLKSAVTTPGRYDPDNNRTFEEFCDHFGTAIYAARVRCPKDKALAENAVQNVQRWVIAPLRNRVFFSLRELNEAIWEKLAILNDRRFTEREGTRASVFIEVDLPALKPLPAERFEYAEWSKVKVHPDCHVMYNRCRYSVHYSHIGKTVDLRVTADGVEAFLKSGRIASHLRLKGSERRSTCDEHLPPTHRAWEMMGENTRKWLESRTGKTLELSRLIYSGEKHPTLSIRRIQGLMSLDRKYGAEEFEKACGYALRAGTEYRHSTLSSILKLRLYERRPFDLEPAEPVIVEHENIRGGDYYK
jgi:transposase